MEKRGNSGGPGKERNACSCPDCRLPFEGPPAWLRDKAVAIWCGTYFRELAEELGDEAAEECATAFAHGFEKGIIMAMLRPEWVQGFYLKLRAYYLLTHTAGDLVDWEEKAEQTCRAIPIKSVTQLPVDK